MAQTRHNPKLADEIMANNADNVEPIRQLPDESDYAPPWLEIDRLKAEFGLSEEEVTFQIFREGPGGYRDISFIKTVSPDEFGYEMLQGPPFNGGKFRVYIRNGSGFKRNFGITVEPGQHATKEGGQTQDGAIASMIAAMSAGFTTLSQQIARQQQAPSQAMGIQDTIALIGSLKPLMTPAAPQAATDPFDMLTKIITLQRDLAPLPTNADGDISGTAVLLKAMETFGPVLANGMKQAPAPQTVQYEQMPQEAPAALPSPTPQPVTENPVQEPQTMDMLQMKLALLKPTLILMASNDADAYPYACMALDMLDDAQIHQYIGADDWWTQLLTVIPEAEPYHGWFVKLHNEILALLKSEENQSSV